MNQRLQKIGDLKYNPIDFHSKEGTSFHDLWLRPSDMQIRKLHRRVVVDGLWNANDADRQLSLACCLVQQIASKLGAIATHQE